MIILFTLVGIAIILLIGLAVSTDTLISIGFAIVGGLLAAAILGISFLLTAGIFWLICWAFALTFSWKIAFGCWLVVLVLQSIFKVTVHKD